MPTYTITIKNKSSQSQSFMLFQDLPKPANIPRGNVFANVYQRVAGVSVNSQATFSISSDLYALSGSSNRTGDGRVNVATYDYKSVNLGPNGSRFYLSAVDGVIPRFEREDQSVSAEGAFVVSTDNTFSFPNAENICFGVGAMAPHNGEVVPVQTYPAKPNVIAQVYSQPKYYVAFGDYEPGTIVDTMTLGDVLSVDFTGSSGHNATFTLDDRYDYSAADSVSASGIRWKVGEQL